MVGFPAGGNGPYLVPRKGLGNNFLGDIIKQYI